MPFPSAEYNRPTGGYLNTSAPGYAVDDADHLVSVQNVVVDYQDCIWALDTGMFGLVEDTDFRSTDGIQPNASRILWRA